MKPVASIIMCCLLAVAFAGTIAGDDTLIIICRAEKIAEDLMEKFTRMVRGVS